MTENFTDIPDESEQLDQLQGDDTLSGRDVADPLDEGYIPADDWSAGQGFGNTADEQERGETLDQRLKQEVPDEGDDSGEENLDDGEVGDLRAGRLVEAGSLGGGDGGDGEDVEKDMIAQDIGIDGAAASAEEAAMHVVGNPDERE